MLLPNGVPSMDDFTAPSVGGFAVSSADNFLHPRQATSMCPWQMAFGGYECTLDGQLIRTQVSRFNLSSGEQKTIRVITIRHN